MKDILEMRRAPFIRYLRFIIERNQFHFNLLYTSI